MNHLSRYIQLARDWVNNQYLPENRHDENHSLPAPKVNNHHPSLPMSVTTNGAVPPYHILIIDTSGSMFDTDWKPFRLDAAKQASQAYVQQLVKQDLSSRQSPQVAVVIYGSSARVMLPFTSVKKHKHINAAISKIDCTGTTNIHAGLEKACGLVTSSRIADTQVVLLTDGENTGQCPKHMAEKLKQRAVLHGVGIGGSPTDVDERLMKQMVSTSPDGKPLYRWIGEGQQLIQHFTQLAGGLRRL